MHNPNRTHFGVGEVVYLSASAASTWELGPNVDLSAGSQPKRSVELEIRGTGPQVIVATHGSTRETATVTGHAPRLHYHKRTEEMPIESGHIGAGMFLDITLTPTNVSFSHLSVRERHCPATAIRGYFESWPSGDDRRRLLSHDPRRLARPGTPEWKTVTPQNTLMYPDAAGVQFRVSLMNYPITSGTFTWRIPIEYQWQSPSGGTQVRTLGTQAVQSFRLAPEGGSLNPPFRGHIYVWKGGQEDNREYP